MIVTTGLARLDRLLADPTIDEVLVNAGRDVWVERCGQLESVDQVFEPARSNTPSSGYLRRLACGPTP